MGFFEKRSAEAKKKTAASFKSETKKDTEKKVKTVTVKTESKPTTSSSSRSSSSRSSKSRSSRSRSKPSTTTKTTDFDIRDIGKSEVASYAPTPKKIKTKQTETKEFDIKTATRSDKASYTPIKKEKDIMEGTIDVRKVFNRTETVKQKSIDFDKPLLDFDKPSITDKSKFEFKPAEEERKVSPFSGTLASEPKEFSLQRKKLELATSPKTELGEVLKATTKEEGLFEDIVTGKKGLQVTEQSQIFGKTVLTKDDELFKVTPETRKTYSIIDPEKGKKAKEDLIQAKIKGYKDINEAQVEEAKKLETLTTLSNELDLETQAYITKEKELTNDGKRTEELTNKSIELDNRIDLLNNEYEELNSRNLQTQDDYDKYNRDLQTLDNKRKTLEEEKTKHNNNITTYTNDLELLESNRLRLEEKGQDINQRLSENMLVEQRNGELYVEPLTTSDESVREFLKTKVGGEKIKLSTNPFVRGFSEAYSGDVLYRGKDSVLSGESNTQALARMYGSVGGTVASYLTGSKGVEKGLSRTLTPLTGEASAENIAKVFSKTGYVVPATGVLKVGGVGLRTIGTQLAKSGSKSQLLSKMGIGGGKVLETGAKALPQIQTYGTIGTLGVSEGSRLFTTTQEKRDSIQKLEAKYGFKRSEGKDKWVQSAEETGMFAAQAPGLTALASTQTAQAGDLAVEQYLDEKGITDPQDRLEAKAHITEEVIRTQGGEVAGLVGGISAGTERLGQIGISKLRGKVTEKSIGGISRAAGTEIGGLGVAEGISSEILTAGTRGKDVKVGDLATSGTIGGISAGVLGGLVVGKELKKATGIIPEKKITKTGVAEFSANILDLAEKPGDVTQSVYNTLTRRTPQPGVIKTQKGGKLTTITPEQQPKPFDRIKTRFTRTKTPQLTTETSFAALEFGGVKIPTFTQTPTTTGVITPTTVMAPVKTPVGTPTAIQTPTGVVTPVAVPTEVPITTPVPTATPIPIFTPQKGGMFIPGLGGTGGWGLGTTRGRIGVKENPIQSLRNKGFLKKKL